jgi:hypothetical protein
MSKVRGARAFRQRLKKLPEAVSAEIVGVLDEGGQKIRAAMQARARRKTGKLAAGVKYKVLPKTLRLQVGLLGTPRGRAKLFYGFILDKGREAKTVMIKRGPRTGRPMKIRARKGDYFVSGRYRELRDLINRRANHVFDRALKRIGDGGRD